MDAAIQKLQEIKLELDTKQKVCACTTGALSAAHVMMHPCLMHAPSIAWHACHHSAPRWLSQEFEKATGKVSAQSKEAFRAALVRGGHAGSQGGTQFHACAQLLS